MKSKLMLGCLILLVVLTGVASAGNFSLTDVFDKETVGTVAKDDVVPTIKEPVNLIFAILAFCAIAAFIYGLFGGSIKKSIGKSIKDNNIENDGDSMMTGAITSAFYLAVGLLVLGLVVKIIL